VVAQEHPTAGTTKVLGHPIWFEKTPMQIGRPAPQQERTIGRSWAGFGVEEIRSLRERRIAYPGPTRAWPKPIKGLPPPSSSTTTKATPGARPPRPAPGVGGGSSDQVGTRSKKALVRAPRYSHNEMQTRAGFSTFRIAGSPL
jgi:hypothetical protein